MINERIYRRVRNGVCAVGYLTGTLEQYLKYSESEMFQVIGTGFLIGNATVLTNRHVLEPTAA
jgi:V8-like Glu-specific endopeptidase